MENLAVFKENGFDIIVDEEAPCGSRLAIRAIPYSKNTTFGEEGTSYTDPPSTSAQMCSSLYNLFPATAQACNIAARDFAACLHPALVAKA